MNRRQPDSITITEEELVDLGELLTRTDLGSEEQQMMLDEIRNGGLVIKVDLRERLLVALEYRLDDVGGEIADREELDADYALQEEQLAMSPDIREGRAAIAAEVEEQLGEALRGLERIVAEAERAAEEEFGQRADEPGIAEARKILEESPPDSPASTV